MTRFVMGGDSFPYKYEKYPQLNAVQLRSGAGAPPHPKTLRRWAKEAPEGMCFVWVVSPYLTHLKREVGGGHPLELAEGEREERFGHLQETAENARLWGEERERIEALGASAVVLETPAGLTPSSENKARLKNFAQGWGELAELGVDVVWNPSGFWEREEVLGLCDEMGWHAAVDPLFDREEPLPERDAVYFWMSGRYGVRSRYTRDDLEMLFDIAEGYEKATVIFTTQQPLRDAKVFAEVVKENT